MDFGHGSCRFGIQPFWQIWQNLAVAKFLDGFGRFQHSQRMSKIQVKVMKLVLDCHHLSNLTV